MPHPPHLLPRAPRRLRRRVVAGLIGATAAVGVAAAGAAPASAAPPRPAAIVGDQHSRTVADLAARAMDAHDVFSYTGSAQALIHYAVARDATAAAVAAEVGVDADAMRDAWARADLRHQGAVLAALAQLGVPYNYNSSQPGVSFDCSGLTTYAWGRVGVVLYRQSGVQIDEAAPRDRESATAGDLVHYPGHVMMYLGAGDAIVHAANTRTDVALSTLREGQSVRFGDPSA